MLNMTLSVPATPEIKPSTNRQKRSTPPLIMDGRCETAIRLHMEQQNFRTPMDKWQFITLKVQELYEELIRTVPGLLEYSDGDVLNAPINNGVLHPLPGMRGIGVVFLMGHRSAKTGTELSVAATFWLAGSSVRVSDQ